MEDKLNAFIVPQLGRRNTIIGQPKSEGSTVEITIGSFLRYMGHVLMPERKVDHSIRTLNLTCKNYDDNLVSIVEKKEGRWTM
jgi:hypothetical protein